MLTGGEAIIATTNPHNKMYKQVENPPVQPTDNVNSTDSTDIAYNADNADSRDSTDNNSNWLTKKADFQ